MLKLSNLWMIHLPTVTVLTIDELVTRGTATCKENVKDQTLEILIRDFLGEIKMYKITLDMADDPKIMENFTKELKIILDDKYALKFSKSAPIDASSIAGYEAYVKHVVNNTLNDTLKVKSNHLSTREVQHISEALHDAINNRGDFVIDFDKLVDVMMSLGILKPKE